MCKMEHQIGCLTAEVMKLDLSDLEDPREDCVLEKDQPALKRINRMAEGLVKIQADDSYTALMRRTQLTSILKTLTKIEGEADIAVRSMERRKTNTRASQEIHAKDIQGLEEERFIDEYREAFQEFAAKKASAIVIQMKAKEVRERVEEALKDVLSED